jgi:uncharacterized protein YndB with AHSA1/START domain
MSRWLVYGLGAVVVLVALVVAIGYALPRGHRVSRTITINAPASDVFGAITNFARYPEWRSDVQRIEILPDDGHGPGFREIGDNGAIAYRVETREPYTRVVTRIADPKLAFGGSWTYDLRPNGAGTDLTITEDGEVYNPVFRFMSRFVFSQSAGIERYQANLKRMMGGM